MFLVGEDLKDGRSNLELATGNSMLKPAAGLYPAILDQAEADPEGKWLAVFRPRRLTAEEIRDTMSVVLTGSEPGLAGSPCGGQLLLLAGCCASPEISD